MPNHRKENRNAVRSPGNGKLIGVRLSNDELRMLDALRGNTPRSTYLRERALEGMTIEMWCPTGEGE